MNNKTIDLSGNWDFAMDSADMGVEQGWYNKALKDSITLPGSMSENNKGNNVGLNTPWMGSVRGWPNNPKYSRFVDADNVKIPFALQPRKYYVGPAWYQKVVEVPKSWMGKSLLLFLERCHWETTVWIDSNKIGMQNSLGLPHVYNLGKHVEPGSQRITIRVDNRVKDINPGKNSHSITDHTQTNWNGIVGAIQLIKEDDIAFRDIQIYPDVSQKKILVKGQIIQSTDKKELKLELQVKGKNFPTSVPKKTILVETHKSQASFETEIQMGENIKPWDEFGPNLYELVISSGDSGTSESFGLRDFKADGRMFKVNGRTIFLRGTLECCVFPKSGHPPVDITEWKRVYSIIKSYGFNHVRFHSWIPPKAAFDAADEVGIYLQLECSVWANQGTTIGDGDAVDQYIYDESHRLVKEYGNHPSFCMMSHGNEPGGENQKTYLKDFINYWKNKDNRRVYTVSSGWPIMDESDYHCDPNPRIQQWGEELNSTINKDRPNTVFDFRDIISKHEKPFVGHENGQWCAYPDFSEIEKYTGVLQAKNFELFKESLEKNSLGQYAEDFLKASGKLQVICYKADIEGALRTPEFAGFQLLGLNDFPGQGTALVGVLNAFWESKGYVAEEEFRCFCDQTVPLARLEKRVFMNTDTLDADIEVAHFGREALKNVIPTWTLNDKYNQVIASGELKSQDIRIGNAQHLGSIHVSLNAITSPGQFSLKVCISGYCNSWDVWVYPGKQENMMDNNILIAEKIDKNLILHLENGGKALLSLGKGRVSDTFGGNVGLGFSSIFWNTYLTVDQKPHTLGLLINPDHPALKSFPTEFHSNWQWWDAVTHADAVQLDHFKTRPETIVRIIDDWFTNRDLALIFEAKVGNGKIIVSGTDLTTGLENRPEARQLSHSLLNYMQRDTFAPKINIGMDELKVLCK